MEKNCRVLTFWRFITNAALSERLKVHLGKSIYVYKGWEKFVNVVCCAKKKVLSQNQFLCNPDDKNYNSFVFLLCLITNSFIEP